MQALVLAGSRGGSDPVASHAGVAQKCLAPLAGRTMIEHVIDAMFGLEEIRHIRIAANDPDELRTLPFLMDPRLEFSGCESTPSLTVRAFIEGAAFPVLVTTADHPLLTPAMLRTFMDRASALDADIAVGLVGRSTILGAHPESRRTWLTFRDGRFSGANLFMLNRPQAAAAVAFWRRVEQDRKKPWRIAHAMGPRLLLSYLLRLCTLEDALTRASLVIGAKAKPVLLPMAEAAIDVDKPEDLVLAERILAQRQNRQSNEINA